MSEKILIALIGVGGAVVGSLAAIVGQFLQYYLKEHAADERRETRKKLLRRMLNHPEYRWRKLDTLMHVIGANEETTKDLLLEVDARASEDGQRLWGLIERNPLPEER